MLGREIRRKYIEFFESKGHLHLPSDSLVPDDPSLLFTSAGMVQFKAYFMDVETPPSRRVVTAQKCLRTDDIDEVGDAVHHTFFEMMGNFSFGDYFKREAIHWAWEFMTEWLHLPEDRIWTSVYLEDDEAADIWINEIKLPAERLVRLGEDKNYWPANAPSKGPNGPCGPCNEIFLDMNPELGMPDDPAKAIAYDSNRFVEIWNLVFTQFVRCEDGSLTPLPKNNIDTGLGLERVAWILQGVGSDYETDLFLPLIKDIERWGGVAYGQEPEVDRAIRIIADHVRSAVFCIADGVMPSNVKRGYVLRRLIRRAALGARTLGMDKLSLADLAPVVAEMMAGGYPEISERLGFITTVLRSEEEKFERTLSSGISRLEHEIQAAKAAGGSVLGGEAAFTLYDTYGFPLELTAEVCAAHAMTLDQEGFDRLMESQRTRAREGSGFTGDLFVAGNEAVSKVHKASGKTQFVGYDATEAPARIVGIVRGTEMVDSAEEGDEVQIALDRTPFYAESGGQAGDTGIIQAAEGVARITDTRKASDTWLHHAIVETGELRAGDPVQAEVNVDRRMSIMRNHTATHLLHAALRKHLGTHVAQAGSLVAPDRLRFDFSHFQAMGPDQIRLVEDEVNSHILEDISVDKALTTLKDAREQGAMALFGEKYGDEVRTVTIGDVSRELCGGTHLDRTSEIGLIKIVSESSVAAGVRRIEALTGLGALEHVRRVEDKLAAAASKLQCPESEILTAIERLQNQLREQQSQLNEFRSRSSKDEVEQLLAVAQDVNGANVICSRTGVGDADAMSDQADKLADKLGSAIIVLASETDGRVQFVCKVTKDLVEKGFHAGNIIREVARAAGGGGGGRPDFAKAGGKDASKVDLALETAMALIRDQNG